MFDLSLSTISQINLDHCQVVCQQHLAQALGDEDRAEKCYKVGAFMSRKRMIGETKKLILMIKRRLRMKDCEKENDGSESENQWQKEMNGLRMSHC
jgi:hypothetical protein